MTARERKRRRLIREAEALERKAAAIRASLVSKGERARRSRTSSGASWPGGAAATSRRGLTVIGETLGMPPAALQGATVADLVSAAGVALREARAEMLAMFAADAEDYPIARCPEVVAEQTDRLWTILLNVLRSRPPSARRGVGGARD